jgi:hypothetical protein
VETQLEMTLRPAASPHFSMKNISSPSLRATARRFALTGVLIASALSTALLHGKGAPARPSGEAPFMKGRRFAATDYTSGKVSIVEADGKVSWTHPATRSNDVWILPGGSLLFGTGNGAKEVAPKDNTTRFNYTVEKAEIYAAQRLPNGNTFVGECSTGKLQEIAPDGKIVRTVELIPASKARGKHNPGGHGFMRNARVLPNGNFLVPHHDLRLVAEYTPEGKKIWEIKTPAIVHSVTRLANGNTLFSCGDSGKPGLYEVTPDKQTAWQLTNEDLPGRPLRFVAGFQVLPNGNVLLCNWLGHKQFGKAAHLMEITRAKQVVWTYADHKQFRTISSVHVFNDDNGPVNSEGFH